DLSDGYERIRQHRAAADLYERLGLARPKPRSDPRRNDDRRGCHFAALPEKFAASRIIRFRFFAIPARFAHRIFAFNKIAGPFDKNEKAGRKSRPYSHNWIDGGR